MTSFRENHPDRKAIQEQIQKHEADLLAIIKAAVKPTIRKRVTNAYTTMMQELEDRKDVQVLIHKITLLRLNEENFGVEHPKIKTIKTDIRGYEAALIEIIKLDRRANSKFNPFRHIPDNESQPH